MNANLYALLRSHFPADGPCLLLGDGSAIGYRQIEAEVDRIAGWLIAQDVSPGSRVVVQSQKSPQLLSLYLAVLKAGAVYAPLNHAYTEAEIAYFIGDAEPSLVVRDAVEVARRAETAAPLGAPVERGGDDPAALIYTSGTTGRSKGAMVTHGNLASNGLTLKAAWGFSADDVLLHALPVFHVHGLFVALHCALLSGARMLWLPRFEAGAVLAALKRATVMMGVPTFYTRLLAEPALSSEAVAGVRLFISGSAPLLAATFEAFEARTGHRILERYGMSEAGMIASNPLAGERMAGSVGYPLPGVALRLADGGGIEIRGPNVFRGYWRMPEKTEEAFTPDGWFRTGDIGRADPDGRVWITGRATDLIISGGLNIYPREIELVLDEVAGVEESAVIGVPHPDFGEAAIAVLVGEADEEAVLAETRRRLAAFKVPKRILFVDALPRNAMGKVQKNVLRERFEGLFGG